MYLAKNLARGILVSPEDISFIRLYSWNVTEGRAQSIINGVACRLHSLILPDAVMIDHKDGNPLNNRRENLRECNYSTNMHNSALRSDSKSGYKGVGWHKGLQLWRARIFVNKREITLGTFVSKEEAALAYNKAALKYFGEFARLNVIIIDESKLS